jgi:tetratricopeptide (TPR) repeat protein
MTRLRPSRATRSNRPEVVATIARSGEEVELTLNIDPTLGDAYWMRGTVQVQMGAVRDALKDLKRAIKLNPIRYEAWAAIGECYDQLRDLPEAIKSFKTALAKQPDNAFWWYRVARIELDRANRTEGGNALKRAISLGDEKDPMPYWLPDAYVLAGQLAEQNRNRQGAIFMYRRYLDIAPDGSIDRPEVEKKLADWNVKLIGEDEDTF